MTTFTYTANPARIVFGPGSLSRVADEIHELGGTRALLLPTPFQREDAERLNKKALGGLREDHAEVAEGAAGGGDLRRRTDARPCRWK